MRSIIQRVTSAQVIVDDKIVGKIEKGILAYVCFAPQDVDNEPVLEKMLHKIINLRFFSDDEGKLNNSVLQVGGTLLLIPNFTLYADCKKGLRPNFSSGISAEDAKNLFSKFITLCKPIIHTEAGIFGAKMSVSSVGDGPLNLIVDM